MDFFKKITISLVLPIIFLSASSPAFAVALNIVPPIQHDGLTFQPPALLSLEKPNSPPKKIEFITYSQKLVLETSIAETPTDTPMPTPTEELTTPTPTTAPTLVATTSTPTPTPTVQQPTQAGSNTSSGGLNADSLFSMSNNYRTSHGLAPLQTDARVCTLAAARAPEIGAEIAEGHMHSGKNSHNFPYWFTENIITMNSEAAAFNWWVNDPIHHDAIVGNYTYSCVACSGNACTQEFTNFQGK